jgi:hypothetical protein
MSEQLVALIQESMKAKGSILSIQDVVSLFLYANIDDYPPKSSKVEKIWQSAMEALQSESWELAFVELEKLENFSNDNLSELQIVLLNVLKLYIKSASGINRGDDEL